MTNLSAIYGPNNSVKWYEKQAGSDGATSETVFTVAKAYAVGFNTLMVFVNGQKAELVTTATNATEYEETDAYNVTFGASLQAADVVEFIVSGLQALTDGDFDTIHDSWLTNNPTAGMKNKIINGNFNVWQRGVSFSSPAAGSFNADRWHQYNDGAGGTFTFTREAFTPGQTDVPNEPAYYLKYDMTVARSGGAYDRLYQKIEDVRTFAGKTITISFYAKAAANETLSNHFMVQNFGDAGSADVGTVYGGGDELTTSWQKITYTVAVPSISGKTVNANSQLTFFIAMPLNQTFEIDIAQIQVEEGSVATPFEYRSFGQELALCQRYYEKSYDYIYPPASVTGAGSNDSIGLGLSATAVMGSMIFFSVVKRVAPTITFYDVDGTVGEWTMPAQAALISGATHTRGCMPYSTAQSGLTAQLCYRCTGQWVADAEL